MNCPGVDVCVDGVCQHSTGHADMRIPDPEAQRATLDSATELDVPISQDAALGDGFACLSDLPTASDEAQSADAAGPGSDAASNAGDAGVITLDAVAMDALSPEFLLRCATNGNRCGAPSECCSGACAATGFCVCADVHGACTVDSDCCSGESCQKASCCAAGGSACKSPGDCCSGACGLLSHTCSIL
jgi:hypothetical protein